MSYLFPMNIIKKKWRSQRDGLVRKWHVTADKKYTKNPIFLSEMFYVGGEFLPYPTGGSKPENNINCRCRVDFELD